MQQSALVLFQRHLQARGHRPSTQERYVGCVNRLITSSGVAAEDVTSEHAYAFLVELANRIRVTASWFNVTFVAIVRWFEMRGVPLNLRGLKPQRRREQPPRWLAADDVRQLLAAVQDRRYRLAFQVVVATGLRVGELCALEVADIDRERPLLRVRCGKGGDGRLVYLPPTLREYFRRYWRTYRPEGVFFQRRPGIDRRPLHPATLNEALARAQVAAGLPERVTTHRLRHTYAIQSLRSGLDIVSLQEQMGHRCIRSTVRYLTPDLRQRESPRVDLLARLDIQP